MLQPFPALTQREYAVNACGISAASSTAPKDAHPPARLPVPATHLYSASLLLRSWCSRVQHLGRSLWAASGLAGCLLSLGGSYLICRMSCKQMYESLNSLPPQPTLDLLLTTCIRLACCFSCSIYLHGNGRGAVSFEPHLRSAVDIPRKGTFNSESNTIDW